MKVHSITRLVLTGLGSCLAITGCAGYRVGTLLPEKYKTIGVPMFRNATTQPNIESLATNAVIEGLNVDGTLRVVEHDPDLLLQCTLVDYTRRAIRYAESIHPVEYRLTITVSATLTDVRERKKLWGERRISGDGEYRVGDDLYSSERAILPKAMEDLAHDIVEAVVEDW